jgi:hypothetical protein
MIIAGLLWFGAAFVTALVIARGIKWPDDAAGE